MTLSCIIIDDEPLARECIANYIGDVEFLTLAGEGNNPLELIGLIEKNPVDLIFLDIQMPVMNGIEFLKLKQDMPMVIITTAYPTYALEGFQLDVMDYLLKPITFTRFFHAVTKAKDYAQLLTKAHADNDAPAPDYFFVKCDYKYERIRVADILYVEAMQNYVTIVTSSGKYITLLNLKNVLQNLDAQLFIKVHKSFVVAISKIETIDNDEIVMNSMRIPISRNYRDEVIERVVKGKLWKR